MAAKSQKHYAVERSPGEGGDSGWAGGRAGGEGGTEEQSWQRQRSREDGCERLTPDGSVLIGPFHQQVLFCFVLLRFHFLFPIFDLIQFYSLLYNQLCSDDGPSWSETLINLRCKREIFNLQAL